MEEKVCEELNKKFRFNIISFNVKKNNRKGKMKRENRRM